jgi:hypothetical protein
MTVYPPQPPKSGPNWPLIVLIGLLAAGAFVTVIALFIGGILYSMRSAAPYQEAMKRATADQRVIAVLGQPMKPSWTMSGSISEQADGAGNAQLNFTLTGPKGAANVNVVATRVRRIWYYNHMTVTPKATGQPIDLLASAKAQADACCELRREGLAASVIEHVTALNA